MAAISSDVLYRSSVLKLLLWFGGGLFLVMSLLMQQLYQNSLQTYQQSLDDLLRQETELFSQLAAVADTSVIQANIETRRKGSLYYYYLGQGGSQQGTTAAPDYPAIANVQSGSQRQGMRATKVILQDGTPLVIGISEQVYQQFQNNLNVRFLWATFVPFMGVFAAAVWFALNILTRLNKVNQSMNQVMCGERGVRLKVSAATDEFDLLAIHLNTMLEQMEQNEARLRSLTVDIAHDLRTPMARLKLRVETLLEQGELGSREEEELRYLQQDFDQLLDTFSGMMELYNLSQGVHQSIHQGSTKITLEPLDLKPIILDVLDFMEPCANEKEQALSYRCDVPCLVMGNRNLLFRAICNLLDNAIKYTPAGGNIEIASDCFGVLVADNGPGIADKDKRRVLDQLVRLDPSRTSSGFGLGLAFVNTVAQLHAGRIVLSDNHPGLRARLLLNRSDGII
ncbi:HAMP domain-containing sensor histidine kinase [Motilimonas eburnea]|uniref:HAMP domain-containing sensor histidine kinase n=1 Tax=Motilimonas eburnea TaxID=1737488 RepID=UPI001E48019B|nr:HAMP domain-containing sensor histidine kinase [Motilimonas eburnea]MCE2572219.1 HAMP domain-containing histidine kinase [Motilimonas eburnea]